MIYLRNNMFLCSLHMPEGIKKTKAKTLPENIATMMGYYVNRSFVHPNERAISMALIEICSEVIGSNIELSFWIRSATFNFGSGYAVVQSQIEIFCRLLCFMA